MAVVLCGDILHLQRLCVRRDQIQHRPALSVDLRQAPNTPGLCAVLGNLHHYHRHHADGSHQVSAQPAVLDHRRPLPHGRAAQVRHAQCVQRIVLVRPPPHAGHYQRLLRLHLRHAVRPKVYPPTFYRSFTQQDVGGLHRRGHLHDHHGLVPEPHHGALYMVHVPHQPVPPPPREVGMRAGPNIPGGVQHLQPASVRDHPRCLHEDDPWHCRYLCRRWGCRSFDAVHFGRGDPYASSF
mmetsp:Transcript_10812/g.25536  ORF Transcript_10812/g.25536 Transcript_10812/m.25536 type:complete len:238 (-) Transcript_10812:368-1081(-)